MAGYVVEVKRSARRISEAAGRRVNRDGARVRFDSKRAAREWADDVRTDDGPVRVQDAAPNDPDPVDGYLVADPARDRKDPPDRPDLETEPLDSFSGDPNI